MPSRSRIQHRGPLLPPASQIILTQKHSFELMKTVITATISHVLWARRVFPNITYNLRSYDPADPEVNYDTFISGTKGAPVCFDASENLMIWKILPRSQDPAVDKVLDCLEIGASDALERGYLAKLQVSLHLADEKFITNSNLIESYTLIFEYDDDQNLKVSSELNVKSKVIRSAKQDLYGLVNDVGFLIHHNNRHRSSDTELPDEFRMLLSLKYNSKAPTDYQPPMFRPGDMNTINILRSGVPNPNLKMNTGFHRLSVGIHVQEDEDLTPVSQLSTRFTQVISTGEVTNPIVQPEAPLYSQVEEIYTQPEAVKQLQKIGISRNLNSDTQDTIKLDLLNSQKTETVKVTCKDVEKRMFPPYTQSILDDILLAQKRNEISCDISKHFECECKVEVLDETLFNCVICGNSKHVRCYGYLDDVVPTYIVCYSCLLEKSDKDRIESKMKPLAIKRRALYYLREKGILLSCAELTPQLKIPKYRITRLLGEFKSYNLLKGSRKDKKRAPMATYIGDDEKLRMLYFRPQQEIDHLFTLSKSPVVNSQYSSCKSPCVSPDGTQNSNILGQVEIPRDRGYSLPDRSLPSNQPDQCSTRLTKGIEDSYLPVAGLSNQISDLIENTPQICKDIGSSTQGSPSPRPRSKSSYIYREQDSPDQKICYQTPTKRSYASSRANITVDFTAEIEETKRLKTSKTSPWIIRNY